MTTTSPTPATTGADNVLELNGISKSFGAVHALDDVTIHIRPNEVIGLIGENGAGKSTLLKILAGLHQHDDGQFLLHGTERRFRDPAEAAALGIGVVHQEQSLLPNLTVAENIYMGSGNTGAKSGGVVGPGLYRWRQLNAEAAAALRAVGSTAAPDAVVDQLSFADRQMVEIAKALKVADVAPGQPLLILDEPTSVLEPKETEVLEREIARLKTVGSVVFVSHRLQEVLRVSDRIYVLRHGKVVAERDAATVVEDELFELMTGRHAQQPRDRLPTGALSMEPMLDVQKLSRRGHFRDIDLQIQPGQVCALVGTVGSGREELSRALFGAEPFDRGRFILDGRPYTRIGIRKAIRRGIGYLPSERRVEGMTAGMSLAENLTLTHPAGTQWGPFIRTGQRRTRTQEWIKRVDLRPDNPDADIAQLSGGNQQKLVLGKWLLADNLRLLILDHPLRGLDPGAKEAVAGLVREACAAGVAVLLLADTLEEALGNGDQIVVMNDGVITGRFDLNIETPTMAQIVERMV